ncbi:hypothetical protein NUW58_g6611 [Xylaria curta]|uniref:Uncharacterized protein n=1 Tax=Xylaria curta TaxID=42375 RepID=A0ACC1NSF0_9PEZI|nr:hypothetical protein NUW58_g6611 [Xylaria curta]
MAAANTPQPQPDFRALSHHLQDMSVEVGRCSNLVAVREANATVDGMADLRRSIEQLTESFNTAVAGLSAQVAGLDTRVADLDTRVANLDTRVTVLSAQVAGLDTRVTGLDTQVAGLRQGMEDMKGSIDSRFDAMEARLDDFDFNNRARALNSTASGSEAILRPLRNTTTHQEVEFPATLGALNSMQEPALNDLLRALGQEPLSRGKKAQLKTFIGVRP